MSYEASLKHKRDAESVFNSAKKSGEALGHAKGLAEGQAKAEAEKRESAIKMLSSGFDIKLISNILGLTVEEIEELK